MLYITRFLNCFLSLNHEELSTKRVIIGQNDVLICDKINVNFYILHILIC